MGGAKLTNFSEQSENLRTAIPSITESSVYYKVTATKSSSSSSQSQVSAQVNQSAKNFTIKLISGTWTIKAEGFSSSSMTANTKILEGQTEITLSPNSVNKNISVNLSPISSGNGSLDLTFSWESETGISKVEMTLTKRNALSASPITETVSNGSASSLSISKQNIESGVYDAKIEFSGTNTKYVAHEVVNIFSNLKTDTWQGSSAYFSKENGKTVFKITKQIVDDFSLKTFYVQGTGGSLTSSNSSSSSNSPTGTYFDPFSTMQAAIDKIQNINDGTSEYKIFVSGTVSYNLKTSGEAQVKISSSKNLNLTIEGYALSDTTANSSSATLEAKSSTNTNSYGSVVEISSSSSASSESSPNIKVTMKNLTIKGGKLTGTSSYNGAGINLKNGNLTLSNVLVTENNSTNSSKAGGIYVASGASLTLNEETQIKSNLTEQSGGGIYVESNGSLTVDNATITQNKSRQNGAGIYIEQNSTVNLTNATITQNQVNGSSGQGAGIYVTKSNVTIKNGEISSNSGVQKGGGIYFDADSSSQNLTLDGVKITSNSASSDGKSIYVASKGRLTFSGGVTTVNSNNEDICLTVSNSDYSDKASIYITSNLSQSNVARLKFVYRNSSSSGQYQDVYNFLKDKTIITQSSVTGFVDKFTIDNSSYKLQQDSISVDGKIQYTGKLVSAN